MVDPAARTGNDAPRGSAEWVREVLDLAGRWTAVAVLIGLGSGIAALLLLALDEITTQLFLRTIAGYQPPAATAVAVGSYTFHVARPMLLPLVPALGGLVGGLLVWRLAPEAAGIGTDAAIRAFHESRPVSLRTSVMKLVTSSISIGAGLTTGREGPIAQVGAGVASLVSRMAGMSVRERNLALAAGIGSGIAAMFKAPLAGALIGAEIFYREDLEVEALMPSIVASVVGYSVVGFLTGWAPVFSVTTDPVAFGSPIVVVLYALLGVAAALAARGAHQLLPRARRFFHRFPLPVATALGGLGVGIVGTQLPEVLGTGYGWMQLVLVGAPRYASPVTLLVLAGGVLLASALTVSSGNSGGVFGPSILVGGFLGAAFATFAHALLPTAPLHPAEFAIVGMAAYFAGAAKAPLGSILIVTEMTGGYVLLGPTMLAVVGSYLLSGEGSILPSQVRDRFESPAHVQDFEPLVLRRNRVEGAYQTDVVTIPPDVTAGDALALCWKMNFMVLPVLEDERLVGMVRLRDLLRVREPERGTLQVRDVMLEEIALATPDEDLYTVLNRLLLAGQLRIPVVDAGDRGKLLGILSTTDIVRVLREAGVSKTYPQLPVDD